MLKLKTKPSIHFVRGRVAHKTLEKFIKQDLFNKSGENYSDVKNALFDLFENTWDDHIDEIEKFDLPKETVDDYHTELKKMIINWFDLFIKENPKNFNPQTEVKLFSKKYKVWGVFDVIKPWFGLSLILDYKISKSMKIYDEQKIQLATYSLIQYDITGNMDHRVGIHFLKFLDGIKIFKPTKKSIQYAIDKINIVRAGTTTRNIEDYPCTCGGWCENDFVS